MKLEEAIIKYQYHAISYLAKGSVKTYQSKLRFLRNHLGDTPIIEITRSDLERVISHYRNEHAAASTRLLVVACKGVFGWALDEQLINLDPTVRLKAPRRKKQVPRGLSDAKLKKVLMAQEAGLISSDWRIVRDATLIYFITYTGVRRFEACGLRWKDIDQEECSAIITGKGNKERKLPLHKRIIPLLDNLKSSSPNTRGHVFCKIDGTPFHENYVNRIFDTMIRDQVGFRVSPHQLRHTFATRLVNAGAGIDAVQDLLGHESIATTRVYVSTNTTRLRTTLELLDE